MLDKINAIEEEYSNKPEEFENMMVDKMDEITEHVLMMDITCNCSQQEAAKCAFKQSDMKDPISDDNASAAKTDNHIREIKCIIWENNFKSESNLEKHYRKCHMTKEPVPKYKCFTAP